MQKVTPSTDASSKAAEDSVVGGRFWQTCPDLLGVLNARGYFESANPAWQAVLGWSKEEV